jgi:membrane protein YdbS with pleckstrin-like domain
MSETSKISIKTGGFTTLLAIAFIVLKLCNVISWSWWWVLSPLWISIAITIIGLLFLFILYIIYE